MRYERILFANEARGRRYERYFLIGGVQSIEG
jgi:hypothetical protein